MPVSKLMQYYVYENASKNFVQHQMLIIFYMKKTSAPPNDKTNKMAFALSEGSDQPGHLPSLIRVFAVHIKKAWVLSYPVSVQQRL